MTAPEAEPATAPTPRTPIARVWKLAAALTLLPPALVALGSYIGPERFAPMALNLFLPQVIWAIPALILLPMCLIRARRVAWLPVLSLLWVAGPLMGFCVPIRLPGQDIRDSGEQAIRLMTYNVKYGRGGMEIVKEVLAAKADVVVIQDSTEGGLPSLARHIPGYIMRIQDPFWVASRLPVDSFGVGVAESRGVSAPFCQASIQGTSRLFTILNVHFTSPRRGLAAFVRHGRAAIPVIGGAADARLAQAEGITAFARKLNVPLIIAGDLNSPPSSLVCRDLESLGLGDAFEVGGLGYGYTYGHATPLHADFMRIDHILVDKSWRVARCWTGGAAGSDHRPVIADLILRRAD